MTDTLEKLFSSGTLIKVMRLFLFNPETPFDIDDVMKKTKSQRKHAKYELKLLEDVGFLKRRTFWKDPKPAKTKSGKKKKKKKVRGFILDQSFTYMPQLRSLLVNEDLLDKREMKKKLRKLGKVKLVLASGVFMQEPDARLDLLIVADKVKPDALHRVIKSFEAQIGAELRYALLGSEDFKYRMSVRDRLLRDVFDTPYAKVISTYKKLELPQDASLAS